VGDGQEDLRERLARAGLVEHLDAFLGLASPSIRLCGEARGTAQMLVRPPSRVWGLEEGMTAIAAGHHSLALREDGTVVAWGSNDFGQLGDGTTNAPHAGLGGRVSRTSWRWRPGEITASR